MCKVPRLTRDSDPTDPKTTHYTCKVPRLTWDSNPTDPETTHYTCKVPRLTQDSNPTPPKTTHYTCNCKVSRLCKVPIQQKQFKMKDLASFQYQNCRQNWGESCLTHSTSYCTALTTDNCLWDQFKKIFSIHIHGQHYWQTAKTLCWHMDSVVFSLINIGVQSKRSEPDLFHSLYCLFWCYIDAVLMLYWCCIDAILMLYWWLFVFVFLNPVGSEW